MQLDDLDMTDTGTGTEVTIEFNYDGLLIQPSFDVRDFRDNITAATDAGTYAITFENVSADDPTTTKDIDKDPFTPTGIAREAVSLTPEEIERFAAQGNNAPGT
jgi:hypothetical protein